MKLKIKWWKLHKEITQLIEGWKFRDKNINSQNFKWHTCAAHDEVHALANFREPESRNCKRRMLEMHDLALVGIIFDKQTSFPFLLQNIWNLICLLITQHFLRPELDLITLILPAYESLEGEVGCIFSSGSWWKVGPRLYNALDPLSWFLGRTILFHLQFSLNWLLSRFKLK